MNAALARARGLTASILSGLLLASPLAHGAAPPPPPDSHWLVILVADPHGNWRVDHAQRVAHPLPGRVQRRTRGPLEITLVDPQGKVRFRTTHRDPSWIRSPLRPSDAGPGLHGHARIPGAAFAVRIPSPRPIPGAAPLTLRVSQSRDHGAPSVTDLPWPPSPKKP